MAAKLANIFYNDSTIKNKIFGADRNPEQIYPEEVLRSILDTGQIDAIAAYKHEAVSRGLPYITLPPQINLEIQDIQISIIKYPTSFIQIKL